MKGDDGELDWLAEDVLASAKYRTVSPALVRALAAEELGKRSKRKDALKAVKNRLHQVAAAYLDAAPQYDAWLEDLSAAVDDAERLRAVCAGILARHVSTRERMPILAQFYRDLFAGLPPAPRIADMGCGFNPLALPWMGLPRARVITPATYLSTRRRSQPLLSLLSVDGRAEVCDLVRAGLPDADVVLLLKTLPNLEQMDRQAGRRLLDTLGAPLLIISYPAHSLGGRRKGMPDHYAARFEALTSGRGWRVERFDYPTELVFRVFTQPETAHDAAA